jgi:cbb3-type cytochrome oxidase maturation protein
VEILYLLIPIAVVVMVIAAVAFAWSVKSGQFEDLEGPAHRILMDDDDPMIPRRPRADGEGEGSARKADDLKPDD